MAMNRLGMGNPSDLGQMTERISIAQGRVASTRVGFPSRAGYLLKCSFVLGDSRFERD